MKYLLLLLWLPAAAQTTDTAGWEQISFISRNHTKDEWVRRGSPAALQYEASLPRIIIHDTIYIRDTCRVVGYPNGDARLFRTGQSLDSAASYRSNYVATIRHKTITTTRDKHGIGGVTTIGTGYTIFRTAGPYNSWWPDSVVSKKTGKKSVLIGSGAKWSANDSIAYDQENSPEWTSDDGTSVWLNGKRIGSSKHPINKRTWYHGHRNDETDGTRYIQASYDAVHWFNADSAVASHNVYKYIRL